MSRKIDLHVHTNISDGLLTPKEVIDEATKNNVSILAIADHDTVDAYTNELYDYAKEKNIILINAVEISTKSDKVGIHILGYNFDINNEELKQKLYLNRNSRHVYLHDVATKLESLGYEVNTNELDKIDVVTKAHIARDIIANPKNEEILFKEFGHVPGMGEFIETIMNEGCVAYVKKETLTPKDAVELIKNAGGVAVLAHPVAYKYEDNLTEEEITKLATEIGVDGLEAYHLYTNKNDERIDENDIWVKIAKENNLITTAGSDFHKRDSKRPCLGEVADVELAQDIIDKIIENLCINKGEMKKEL